MLFLRQTKHLAARLGVPLSQIEHVADSAPAFCEELILVDPAKPGKQREVLNIRGDLRKIQWLLYGRVLLPKLNHAEFSHGGIAGRNIKTNLKPHQNSRFVFKTDISNFYPSIHYKRVYRLFTEHFVCSPDVARLCTKLCTYKHHLALGLITSPILADQILENTDRRIGGACKNAGLRYSRYVDDITISGPYSLENTGFVRLVQSILKDQGFATNPSKNQLGSIDAVPITNIRVNRGHPDVSRDYIAELERLLDDASSLAMVKEFRGPYLTKGQIWGKIQFVCWVNPYRRRQLASKFRSIPWEKVEMEARERGLIVAKKTLLKQIAETCSAEVVG